MPSAPPRPSIRRVAPLQWETTASYIQRLARRHHLTTAELLNGLGIPRPHLKKERTQPHAPHTGIELYLNAPSRRLIASFTGVPEEHLSYALPQWDQYRDKPNPASARARLQPAPVNAVTGCPGCTLARTGHRHPVRQYLPDSRLICRRHHTWMLGRHTLAGTQLPIEHADLGHTPEILAAHRTHIRFLRRWGTAADHALAQATSLTEAWRRTAPAQERIWPARARRIASNKRTRLWYALARAAITYPETITLAQYIAHHPRTLLALERPQSAPPVHNAIAALLGRPWLQDPALYPHRLNHRINYAPSPHPGAHPRWTYRQPGPTELTHLGYHPPKTAQAVDVSPGTPP
ncbi:TniQ family protein [Streptomyces sp. NBC_00557]|uniref:TniQ family protein n=1 Tax=Streptomyces sp. NBC_00557 TaxID=2975776 RepID=UPI002E810523|nr:TniQ family protein [Streptomyces sp. NBC_00557]WUC32730.1 TniQ family protein [Streptomyces sp. NBC_00557]WUC40138.1 TniQ family protein [Streptomyces sp. NBC_00557]WUC40358.1 TniQ family protein [Streptomyces sp. NBC_00557]